jgi:hypothetical protein
MIWHILSLCFKQPCTIQALNKNWEQLISLIRQKAIVLFHMTNFQMIMCKLYTTELPKKKFLLHYQEIGTIQTIMKVISTFVTLSSAQLLNISKTLNKHNLSALPISLKKLFLIIIMKSMLSIKMINKY